jgi:hypothetical protein
MLSSGHCVCDGCGFDDGSCVCESLFTNVTLAPAFTMMFLGETPALVMVIVVVSVGGVLSGGVGFIGDPPPPHDHNVIARMPVNPDASQCRRSMSVLPEPCKVPRVTSNPAVSPTQGECPARGVGQVALPGVFVKGRGDELPEA